MKVDVHKLPQNSPDDISALDAAIATGKISPHDIVAIMGKTEGNGCVNDFTRGFAVQSLQAYLGKIIGQAQAAAIVYVMSGGTEGVLSPHLTVFTSQDSQPAQPKRMGLTLGVIHTRDFSPAEIGSLVMVEEVAEAVTKAIAAAGLAQKDVHFVQIKCPLITSRDRQLLTDEKQLGLSTGISKAVSSYQSMGYSRGASALGVAVALDEIRLEDIKAEDICQNYDLYSSIASTSAGVELRNCEILVMGNSPQSTSDFVIGHSVMQHALDVQAIHQAIAVTGQPIAQVVNIFAKAEADPTGAILGRRHTMMDDSDINHTRMARAVVGAVVASIVQDPMVYVSGGSEHQGPSGGGPVAAIAAIK
ncbi:ring-opening amidohydrolase [Pseudanabaena sp. FACHB-1998]|uniref:cyanuric acid amidohydrolase n=1 Tax=Pseudanabaena sp. FACHB-1998 TaxID=2692858 RepID=UPI001680FE8F|nr:ring-opening amidohydrolase [Pseudanabaena sp. FACHB-1998]MBD2176576.1 ring-opening amidohydrolase [Pseudanabaena sp. FACHB-1998]